MNRNSRNMRGKRNKKIENQKDKTFYKKTLSSLLILIFALMLFEISLAITFLFISSITAYLFIFANKKLIEELELISITSIEN